jgi:predicted DNA-binding antitoxin AbrB/MazE fold protein
MEIAMSYIDAIYRHGVFEPLQPVTYREEQRVRLCIATASEDTPQNWLNQLNNLHAGIIQRQGHLPDSASDIAMDRQR